MGPDEYLCKIFGDALALGSAIESALLGPSSVSAMHLAADSTAQKDDKHEPLLVAAEPASLLGAG